jgi:four helix bundle protein
MKTHKDLIVWNDSISFVTTVYKATEAFPAEEKFGLTNQIRRCAVSIPSNVAEGAARTSNKEFAHFLAIALGSIAELETQLIIALNLKYLNENDFNNLIQQLTKIRKMTLGLRNKVNKK